MSPRRTNSIVPYFGGKRTLAPTIVKELGEHRAYFELGCGSLAVLLAKEPTAMETAVDLHGQLMNLARVIQDDDLAPELYERLQRTVCAEDVFERSVEWLADAGEPEATRPDPLAAYHYFVASWIGRNGVAGTRRINYQMAVRFTPGGGHGAVRFRSAVESLPWWHRRLRHTTMIRRDMFDVLPRIQDDEGVAIYVDPPYLKATRSNGGGGTYLHDFDDVGEDGTFFDIDAPDSHARLAEELARFELARVVVSYYDHPRLKKLYPPSRWTHRAVTRQKSLHTQNRRGEGRCEAPEVLLINGPSNAG